MPIFLLKIVSIIKKIKFLSDSIDIIYFLFYNMLISFYTKILKKGELIYMSISKKAKRAEARRKHEEEQKARKMARLGVNSLPEKPRHKSKKVIA